MTDPHEGGRSALRAFLDSEAAGGIVLMAAAALALLAANGPFGEAYRHTLHLGLGWRLPGTAAEATPHLLINDGLMAIFFLLVGLEIKREWVDGRLSTWSQRRLPLIAAGVGMAVPAALYLALTRARPGSPGAGRYRRRPTSPSQSACSLCSAGGRRFR